MKNRRHGSKPTIALWMLVAVADVVVLAAAAGPLVTVVTVATLVAVVAGGRALVLSHRRAPARSPRVSVRRLVAAVRNTPQTEVVRRSA
jgi:hypothetical protein